MTAENSKPDLKTRILNGAKALGVFLTASGPNNQLKGGDDMISPELYAEDERCQKEGSGEGSVVKDPYKFFGDPPPPTKL